MRLTKQYAEGLLQAAPLEEKVSIYYELIQLCESLKRTNDYVTFLEFEPEEMAHFRELLIDEYHPLTINFLEVLAEDGMLHRLETILIDYQNGLIEENLLQEVKVYSAAPLSQNLKEKIEQMIQLNWGSDYLLDFYVNRDLIGGIRLEVNDAVIDTTFRSRINQILREV